jgi:tetratricopeptide (TPR) repeat protein
MFKLGIPKWLTVLAIGLAVVAFTPQVGFTAGDDPAPKPKPDPKPQPKPKPKPKGKDKDKDTKDTGSLNDDRIYSLGYWQAKSGEYETALATLRSAANQADPRVQTMIGFSLRKLGKVDEAMTYYQRVLASHPDKTNTRQYLGEAFLQLGQPDKAREQLAEIATRCGVACDDYRLLAEEIAKYQARSG